MDWKSQTESCQSVLDAFIWIVICGGGWINDLPVDKLALFIYPHVPLEQVKLISMLGKNFLTGMPLCVLDGEEFPKMLLTIQIAEFLDHQHLWSESNDISVSLHGDNYQWKVVSGTNIFGWVWAGMPLIHWDCKILRRSISPEEVKWYLRFFCMEIIINGRQPLRLLLLFECGYVCPSSKQIVRFFD